MNTQVNYFKKALVVLMAVMMVFTMMPGMAWAADGTETSDNEQITTVASGTCGAASNEDGADSVTWKLTSDGVLEISGNGAMADFDVNDPTWIGYMSQIKSVKIVEGVTSIGGYAFYEAGIISAIVSGTVTKIGESAFINCKKLTTVTIESGTKQSSIGNEAFSGCSALKQLTLSDNITSVGKSAFSGCSSLKQLALPSNLTSIGANAFRNCSALEKLTFPSGIKDTEGLSFSGCTNLQYIEFENVTTIVPYTFSSYTALDQLVLPKSLTTYSATVASFKPKLVCFEGSEEEWNAVTFAKDKNGKDQKDIWAEAGTIILCNYDAAAVGTPAEITSQPEGQTIKRGQQYELSVSVKEEAETQYYYRWFKQSGDTLTKVSNLSESATCKVDSSKEGTANYYCEVVTVKDGKTAVMKSEEAEITVQALTLSFEGSGTQADPYQLSSTAHMSELAELVNSGISFEGKYFKLTADITLPEGWIPMGCKKDASKVGIEQGENLYAFSGTIDGAKADGTGNYTLTVPKDGLPLLGYVKDATVKNLNLAGERINDYGLVNNFEGVGLSGNAITIENVTIKSGTNIVKSGLIGANITENPHAGVSAAFVATIRNCTIEKGAVIGCDGDQNVIGGFAGRMQGTIENCKNYGTVKGKNVVGGIIGTRDNSLETCTVQNCEFFGIVSGDGNVGGIVGSGYMANQTAPNSKRVEIICCKVAEGAKVSGNNNVGGILGSDLYVAQVWDNVIYSFVGNSFSGQISGKTNVGGIIGFYDSLNKYDNIAGNFYKKGCGATKGIGTVKYVDTNAKKTTQSSGTIYINTEYSVNGCPEVAGCKWKTAHNRTDDPLGADKENLTKEVASIPDTAFCYELALKSGNVKTEYYEGDEFDFNDAKFIGTWTDGSTKEIDSKDITITGYNKNSNSVQNVTLSYDYAQMTVQVAVLKKPSSDASKNTITVSFTLLGDDKHDESANTHALSKGNLKTWISKKTYTLDLNSTAGDLFKKALAENSLKWTGTDKNQYNTLYIASVQIPGTTDYLGEFDNGPNSGWMYTINGKHPEVGIDARFLNDGDEMIFHYTDDYNEEEDASKWNSGAGTVEEVKDVTTDTKTGTTTAPTEVKVSEKTAADGTKTKVAEVKVSADNQKEILKQAKASKSKEIILNVSKSSVGDATKADVTLDKSFIDSIVKDTDAKLTIKTSFGDKTYTQEELKAMSEAATGSTVTVVIEKAAEQPTDDTAANIAKAKSIVKDMKLVARSSQTAKKNIKAVLKSDAKVNASIKELKELGFTVKYRFYRSTKKAASYKSTVTKKTASYTNTSGKKGTKYFYKVQVRVYDENGKLVAKTALKQCKYASRTWTK